MPRNASGVYSLPNPDVVPNTTILSSDENETREDIAEELTNSLDRNGRGPMLAPVRAYDGLINLPSYSWNTEINSGLYKKATNEFWFAVAGVDIFGFTATGVEVGGSVVLDGYIPESVLTAKGSLIAASAAATPADVPVGSDGQVLVADSGETAGVKWEDPAAAIAIPPSILSAKGSLIVASAAATPADLPVGTDEYVLTAENAASVGVSWQIQPGFAQCRFVYSSTSACFLVPHGGDCITIENKTRRLSATGSQIGTGGMSDSTLYYIYAYWNSGTGQVTLEASTTAWAVPVLSTRGMPYKIGDVTRILVGMVRVVGGLFVDTVTKRFVRSWFNDPNISSAAVSTASTTISSAPYVELDTAIRCEGLFWSGEYVHGNGSFGALAAASPSSGTIYSNVRWNTATALTSVVQGIALTRANEWAQAVAHFNGQVPSEGYHYLALTGGITTLNAAIQSGYTGLTYRTRRHATG